MKRRIVRAIAMTASLLIIATTSAGAQDPRCGEYVFRQCVTCHAASPSERNALAPPLFDIVGRRAATIPGFQYSDIMKQAARQGLFWSSEALFYFLDRPDDFMPGNYMAFSVSTISSARM